MVWIVLVLVLVTVAKGKDAPPNTNKFRTLEKQVEILANLVHAQSKILTCCKPDSGSNPSSEHILKLAEQAKKISDLEGEVKTLQTTSNTQAGSIKKLQKTVSDLSAKLTAQETKLTSLDNKYSAEVSKLRTEIQNVNKKTNTVTNNVNQLKTQVQQARDQWPSGSYCILASGSCPAGFTKRSGFMKAISLYAGNGNYINQGTFGDSKIKCHGRCGQYGHWTGELYIYACCK